MKIREIERLRAFAILMVLIQHLPKLRDSFHPWFRQGGPGVDLFFVISGYVVSRSLVRSLPAFEKETLLERVNKARPALAAFMARRIHRILPMALLWALIPLALSKWVNVTGAFGKTEDLLKEVFAIVTLQYNYAFAHGNGGRYSYYWSLAVEEHFYLLLPILMVALGSAQRRILGAVGGILLVQFVLRPYIAFDGPKEWKWAWDGFMSHRKFDFLFTGVLIYLLREQGFLASFGEFGRGWARLLGHTALFGILTIQGIIPWDYFLNSGQAGLEALAGMAVLLASFERGVIFPIPGLAQALEWLGSRSYGVYLIHHPMRTLLEELHNRKGFMPEWFMKAWEGPWTSTFMIVGVTFVVAELCFRLIEKPLMERGHRVGAELLARGRQAEPIRAAAGQAPVEPAPAEPAAPAPSEPTQAA